MLKRRTDLALEAAQLWQESAGEAGTLPGVESEEATREGYPVTTCLLYTSDAADEL